MITHDALVQATINTALNANVIRRTLVCATPMQTLTYDFSYRYASIEATRLGAFNLGLAVAAKTPPKSIGLVAFVMPCRMILKEQLAGTAREVEALLITSGGQGERLYNLFELIRGQDKKLAEIKPLPPPNNIQELDGGVFMAFAAGIVSRQMRGAH